MSKVRVNDSFIIEGKFSIEVSYERGTNPMVTDIRGAMTTSAGYLPDIQTLENERYRVDGIFVDKEVYGSEEDNITYYFSAKQYAMAKRFQEVQTVE